MPFTAWRSSLKIKRSLFLASALLVGWVLTLLIATLGAQGGYFIKQYATFFALFAVQSLIAPAAIVLMRLYLLEKNGKKVGLKKLFFASIELVITSILLPLPLLILFLVFFLFLSLFLLLTWIPLLGHLFGIFLAFAPFVLNLGIALLFGAVVLLYFLLLPQIALDGSFDRKKTTQALKSRLLKAPLALVKECMGALLPLLVVVLFVVVALYWTVHLPLMAENSLEGGLQNLVMGIPVLLVLTPAFTLFFHLSLETLLNHSSKASAKKEKPLAK